MLTISGACGLRADGGHVALRASAGAYTVTLFTAPEPLVCGPVDLSVLVQDQATGEVLDDATATATLTAPSGGSTRLSFTHQSASNKLLLAATPTLAAPGTFTLILQVERPGVRPAGFTAVLPVAASHRRRTTLISALLLPLAAILLFLVNQQAKLRRRSPRPSALH